MSVGGWIKRRAGDAKRKAEQAKRKAEEAARAAERKAREAEAAAKRAKREAERIAREKAAAAKRQAERAAKELTVGLIDDIKDAASSGKREIEKAATAAARKAEEKITEEVPDLIGAAFEALAAALTSEALAKVRAMLSAAVDRMDDLRESKPALVDEINALGFRVELGPVTLKYAGFYDRADDLMSALSTPPALRRSSIRQFVQATGPTSADLGISVQVVAVVVGSKEMGIGGGFDEIGGNLVVELLDAILEAAGVPE